MCAVMGGGASMGGKGGKGLGHGFVGGKSGFGYEFFKPTLDEKYFRHIASYNGDHATHRTFVTDMVVAVARLDGRLARALRKILMEPDENMKMDEKEWEAVRDGGVNQDVYEQYRYELFGLVSSKIGGEAKKIATSMAEDGREEDVCGFRLLWIFKKRWNAVTFSTKLSAFLKILTPCLLLILPLKLVRSLLGF